MKTAVVYYTLGGTTRAFARAEAQARGADLIELRPARPQFFITQRKTWEMPQKK